jgi:hypothetical protein
VQQTERLYIDPNKKKYDSPFLMDNIIIELKTRELIENGMA